MRIEPETVLSADATPIAFERAGVGAPVILIGGAYNDRSTVAGLAATLAPWVTAVAYDRRGRGASGGGGDAGAAAVEREIEDLAALIGVMGGPVSLFGHSSGALLAIEAVRRGLAVDRLAVYEPPYIVAGTRPNPKADLGVRIVALLSQRRRDDAVALFQGEGVGLPAEMIDAMRSSEVWAWLTGLAHTLPYDEALFDPGHTLPADRLATIGVPTLAIDGSESPNWLRAATRAVAGAVPGARYVTLPGQDHGVLRQPEALRPVLLDLLGGPHPAC